MKAVLALQNGAERMTTRAITRSVLCATVSLLLSHASLPGQEVQWRNDYGPARKEAVETGRPMMLDFTTENCFWCKQLELRTFLDPEVVALLNNRCIPVKIDAGRFPQLVEALHIHSFPTLVYATPEGKILGYQEGFLESGPFKEHLNRTIAAVAAPDWMTRDYQDALQASETADFPRALSLLKNVVEDGKERPIQIKARRLLQDLEQQAATRFAKARDLADKGKVNEALEVVNDVAKVYPGTQAASESRQLMVTLTSRSKGGDDQRARHVRDLMNQAREDYRTQQFLCCLDRCELVTTQFADQPEATEAAQLAAEIKSNPEWTKQACDQLGDRLSLLYLSLADIWLKKGQPQQAVFYLERVIQTFPNSRHAEAAQVRLAQIQGPGGRVGEKR
jgi:tetratricopeptide (TPR) repeat protein